MSVYTVKLVAKQLLLLFGELVTRTYKQCIKCEWLIVVGDGKGTEVYDA